MIVFTCPHCEKHFKLSDRFAGRDLLCSGCKTEIAVPGPEEELGLATVAAQAPRSTPQPRDIYTIPKAEAVDVRATDSKVLFDCSNCGKHYVLSHRFAGRNMLCSGCKSELVVPASAEAEPHQLVPPPLPEPPAASAVPPPPGGFNSSSGFDGFDDFSTMPDDTERYENAMAVRTEEDSAILSYVYQEKHSQEKHSQEKHDREEHDAPEPVETSLPIAAPGKKRHLAFWASIFTVLAAVGGIGAYLALSLETLPPDGRPALLERIAQQKTRSGIESGEKEAAARRLRTESLEAWNTLGDLVDNYLVTFGESFTLRNALKSSAEPKRGEIETALSGLEKRLEDFSKQIRSTEEHARQQESASVEAAKDSATLADESRFYAEEETKLSENIRSRPADRTAVSFPTFVPGRTVQEEPVRFDADWTENDFFRFDFPGISPDRYFAAPDGLRRFFGDRSIRVTVLDKQPVTVIFPQGGRAGQNLESRTGFVFSIRFPGIDDRIVVGPDPESGRVGEFRVRLANSSGHVDYTTTSPRYCNALYFDARGRYTTIEFPFSGDPFWKRTDHFDLAGLDRSDETIDALLDDAAKEAPAEPPPVADSEEPDGEASFFSRIDRIEIHITPLSAPTTIWLDGISVSEKEISGTYDLLRAESLQSDLRKKDEGRFRQRTVPEVPLPENESNSSAPVRTETAEPTTEPKNVTDSDPPEFAGSDEQRLRKIFIGLLQDCNGRIRARVRGRQQSFGPKSPVPDSFEDFVIEEVDVSRTKNLTDEKLDQLAELKELRKLNLSYTGLKDDSLIRLATLTKLESLNLAGNDLTFAGIPGIQTLKNLRELNLNGIRTSVDGIDALGNLTGLRSLSLSRSLTDSGDLIYLLTLTELEHLDLSGSRIADRALANLRAFPTLQSLNLSKTRITDSGMAQLDRLRNLRRLDLDETGLTDACLPSLGRLESLTEISVLKTKITRDGVRTTLGPGWTGRFKFSE